MLNEKVKNTLIFVIFPYNDDFVADIDTDEKNKTRYVYICNDYNLKVGDIIKCPSHNKPAMVVDIIKDSTVDTIKNKPIRTINIESINNNKVYPNKNKTSMKKNGFSGILNTMMSQYVPARDYNVRMTYDLSVALPDRDGNYICMSKEGTLKRWPAEMTFEIPIFTISKLQSQVVPGDIVKNGNSYSFVKGRKANGSLQLISASGYSHNKQDITDAILGASTVTCVVNMFNNQTGFNPMMFMLLSKDDAKFDTTSLMMFMSAAQNGGANVNMQSMMPLMMLQSIGEGDDTEMSKMLPMMMMMNGGNMFGGNMFGNMTTPTNPVVENASTGQAFNPFAHITDNIQNMVKPVNPSVNTVSSEENDEEDVETTSALKSIITSDPNLMKELKDLLKEELMAELKKEKK
jgi:hypothetical protein